MKATFVKDCSKNFTGTAYLYKLSEPIAYPSWVHDEDEQREMTEYVVVSATNAFDSGPETYIFPANQDGDILKWGELNGSFKGNLDHKEALRRLGCEEITE